MRERAAALGLDQRQAWRLNTELSCQRPSGLKLAQAVEIGVQGNRIAAGVGRGEIRPDAAAQVDLEASRIAVVARRIAANVLTRLDATAGNPFLQDGRESRECSAVDPVEVDRRPAHRGSPETTSRALISARIRATAARSRRCCAKADASAACLIRRREPAAHISCLAERQHSAYTRPPSRDRVRAPLARRGRLRCDSKPGCRLPRMAATPAAAARAGKSVSKPGAASRIRLHRCNRRGCQRRRRVAILLATSAIWKPLSCLPAQHPATRREMYPCGEAA